MCATRFIPLISFLTLAVFRLAAPAPFKVEGTKITKTVDAWETLIVHPAVDRVCTISPF
jgi:hypothetical protein